MKKKILAIVVSFVIVFSLVGQVLATSSLSTQSTGDHNIFLNANGGTVNPNTVAVTYGEPVGPLPTPILEGYAFLGWFDDQGKEYTAETIYDVDGILILYARWEKALIIDSANLRLGIDITMFFYINTAYLKDTEWCYATITRSYSDGVTPDDVVTVPYDQWQPYDGDVMRISYPNLAARQMNDTLTVVIYDGLGEPVSNVWNDSVRDYCERMITRDTTPAAAKTVLVDLLNYGAAAQTYFDYDPQNLANRNLTSQDQELASAVPTLTNNQVKGANYDGSTLTLKNKILLTLYFENIDSTMYATVTYKDYYGQTQTVQVSSDEFVRNGDFWGIQVDSLIMAEYKNLVTVTVYDSEDQVVASASDSMESYLARMFEEDALYSAIAKVLSGALAYANSKA